MFNLNFPKIDSLKDGRGHKKKKVKAIKKALIKLVLIALLIKSKLKILLTAFQTFLGFKGAVLVGILVITHAVKLWAEIKHHQTPQKVIYYENAHHQHHYDHHDHDDHHGGWSLWGRSGEEASSTPSSGILSYLSPLFSRRADSADLAYSAYGHYNPATAYGPPDGQPTTDRYYRSLPTDGHPTTDRYYRSLPTDGHPTTDRYYRSLPADGHPTTDRHYRSLPSSELPNSQVSHE